MLWLVRPLREGFFLALALLLPCSLSSAFPAAKPRLSCCTTLPFLLKSAAFPAVTHCLSCCNPLPSLAIQYKADREDSGAADPAVPPVPISMLQASQTASQLQPPWITPAAAVRERNRRYPSYVAAPLLQVDGDTRVAEVASREHFHFDLLFAAVEMNVHVRVETELERQQWKG